MRDTKADCQSSYFEEPTCADCRRIGRRATNKRIRRSKGLLPIDSRVRNPKKAGRGALVEEQNTPTTQSLLGGGRKKGPNEGDH